ncbi:MAG: dephospho-CoA kinase [Gammaproteobacteria bacterium]|nr:dephospho-CoA kinase [Gammaproteobacteria bacterium]MDH3757424.1 dephospho-CoA kinase [Gammaproteobacteria bacterium]MDH3805649.1 dephospho-CoA kinase [Gammaproteobacteria bacterium]
MAVDTQKADKPLRVGLTGGIASGKSTVADMFAALGVAVVDTDVIAREVVMPGQPALREIRRAFGESAIDDDGVLDRAAMRQLVFADDAARLRLEMILHPRIQEETRRQANEAGGEYQIIVIPLLVESSLKSFVDRILVVDCDESSQLSRLLERDAESEAQARRILAAQTSRSERLAIADDIITNDGTLSDTQRQVQTLHKRYLDLQGRGRDASHRK